MRGHLKSSEVSASGITLHFHHPGVETEVTRTDDGLAAIRESRWGVMVWLGRLHHDAGLWWDEGAMNVWGVFVLVTSLAMFVLGSTGIYLWWKLGIERRTGVVLLFGSVVYTLGLVLSIRLA